MVKRIRNISRIIGWSLGITTWIFTNFLTVSQLHSRSNVASNTASKKRTKKSIYFNRAVTCYQKYYCDCSIRVSWSSCMFYACKLKETIHFVIQRRIQELLVRGAKGGKVKKIIYSFIYFISGFTVYQHWGLQATCSYCSLNLNYEQGLN